MRNAHRWRASLALDLLLWDVLLAFAMWQVVFALNAVLVRMEISMLSGGEIIDLAPSVVVWTGIRAALGLYPGKGPKNLFWPFKQLSELDRQAFALGTTVAALVSFPIDDFSSAQFLQSPLVLLWALGLLVIAHVVRHYVKASLLRGRRL
jgi:hypothetical protein